MEAIAGAGVASYNSGVLSYTYRHIDPISFAFILHSELPGPGIYDISLIEKNKVFIPQLWHLDELSEALYILRNMKFLPKISEIDTIRQFTTIFTLEQFVANV